jgi:hypothetical protein
MADLKMVYQLFASADPMVNGQAGNWSDNCERLRGRIRNLSCLASASAGRPLYVPDAARPTTGS